jgi:osmotically-inducible protein OsmY
MPTRKTPTYEDITRKTVPNLDSSFRPSVEQEEEARHGFRAVDQGEQELQNRVQAALAASGLKLDRVTIEVDRDLVTVRGQVSDQETLNRVAGLIRNVKGVADVVDQLVIA